MHMHTLQLTDADLDELVQAMKVGHGLDDGAAQDRLIDEDALAKVEELVVDAVQHGTH